MPVPLPRLADLIDADGLQSLMSDFYEVARIPMSIVDLEGRVLVGVGWQDVCTKFHRVHPETCKACLESDTKLSAGIPPGEFRIYRCKNHMWDAATPLMVRDQQIGNVFCGQFFFEGESIDHELFRRQARRYGFDEREYIAALDGVPRLTRATLDRGLAFFTKLAQMVSRLGDANFTLARTVSERDTLTQSLHDSQADLARAQGVSQTGSWRLDVHHNVLTWSEEAHHIFAVPPATSLSYDTFLASVHPDDRAAVDEAWRAALTGKRYDIDHRIVVGGEIKWVRECAELELDAGGALLGGFGTVQDITERKRLEGELRENVARLAEANRLKDEFLSTLSHELRTPLSAVVGWSHLLLGGQLPGDRTRQALEAIDRNAKAQLALVSDLLDVARVIRGQLRLDVREVQLGDCLNAALDAVRPAADAKQIALAVSIDPHAPIAGDPDRLQQILWNVLSNAVKFTPPGGRVDVSLSDGKGHVQVSVRDTGIGIAPEFMPHIFEQFRQADGSFTRAHAGLGLGLAIVRHLVELHGGEVTADSEGPGRGATFTVTFRVSPAAGRTPATADPATSSSGTGCAKNPLSGLRILVVDDEPDAVEYLNVLLGDLGAEVRTAGLAGEGFAMVQQWRPAVIVSDIAMPGEDGFSFIHRVRLLPERLGGATPMVALTAHAGPVERARALEAGFLEHLVKPFEPASLVAVLRALPPSP